MNLFDITRGNYRVLRSLSYPQFATSRVMLDVRVRAESSAAWTTEIYILGRYDGPNDIVANRDYEIEWTADSGRLLEAGRVTLLLASGGSIRQEWSSIITPENKPDAVAAMFKKFPRTGQIVTAEVSPFTFSKNGMSYTWEGLARRRPRQPKGK